MSVFNSHRKCEAPHWNEPPPGTSRSMRAARRGGSLKGGARGRGRGGKGGKGGGSASSRAAALSQFDKHFVAVYGARWAGLRPALIQPVEHVAWVNPFAASSDSVRAVFDQSCWHSHKHESGCHLLVRGVGTPGELAELPAATNVAAATHSAETAAEHSRELTSHYALDGASPLPALVLAPRAGHRVLDLCAAPGGKTLCLAGQMFAHAFVGNGDESGDSKDDSGLSTAHDQGVQPPLAPLALPPAPSQPMAPPPQPSPRAAQGVPQGGSQRRSLLVSNDRSAPRRARLRRVIEEFVPKL